MIANTNSLINQLKKDTEQYYLVTEISWQEYENILENYQDRQASRITYFAGVLKILSPSLRHETIKTRLGSLLELYFLEKGIDYYPMGSSTFIKQEKKGGIEPDESYCFGCPKEFPDLAIEVVLTSGGIDSLRVYASLGVTEVWFWQNERFSLYHLRSQGYEAITQSELLPDLDLELFARCLENPHPLGAAQEFRRLNTVTFADNPMTAEKPGEGSLL